MDNLGMAGDGPKSILVVDDERAVRDFLADALVMARYAVSVAAGAEEAWHLFQQVHFDLVITDLRMPGVDGWELAARIKSHSERTPVIAISAIADLDDDKTSTFDRLLRKPIGVQSLMSTVEEVLRSGCKA